MRLRVNTYENSERATAPDEAFRALAELFSDLPLHHPRTGAANTSVTVGPRARRLTKMLGSYTFARPLIIRALACVLVSPRAGGRADAKGAEHGGQV